MECIVALYPSMDAALMSSFTYYVWKAVSFTVANLVNLVIISLFSLAFTVVVLSELMNSKDFKITFNACI